MEAFRQNRHEKEGFTILEVVAALAVIAILMTALAVGFQKLIPLSESKRARADIARIQMSLEEYKESFGEYPKETSVGAATPAMETILFNALAGTLSPNGKLGNFPSLLDRMALEFQTSNFPVVGAAPQLHANAFLDPWGNPYRYRYDPDDANWENFNYVLFSAGPDGAFAEVTAAGQKNESHQDNQDNIYSD